MTRGSKLTNEERIAAVQEYQDGKGSYRAIGEKYGVSDYVIRTLVNRAKSDGIDFVKVSRTNKKYSMIVLPSTAGSSTVLQNGLKKAKAISFERKDKN